MSWTIPNLSWLNSDVLTATDFNRIEKNIKYLQELLG